jgi:hypothetical protein
VARKRYQQGSLILRGTRVKKWYGRWLEDELQLDGSVIRIHRSEILGDKSEFPTKRLAQRELDRRLAAINSPIYKAKPTARFEDFAEKWKSKVSIHYEGSTQDSEKSEIKAWVAALGAIRLRDISTEVVQDVITLWSSPGKDKRSEKTIRNRVATLRLLWASAKAWGYVTHDVCDDLVLPTWNREEQPSFTVEQVKQIIDAAPPIVRKGSTEKDTREVLRAGTHTTPPARRSNSSGCKPRTDSTSASAATTPRNVVFTAVRPRLQRA